MARKALLGNKLRRLRRERALSQVELAKQIGISASYLNLIEHNQRPLTPPLLLKVADRFQVGPQTFSQDGEARLYSELNEVFGDPLFQGKRPRREEIGEAVDLAPALGPAMVTLYRAYRTASADLRALSERLSDERFLSTSTHELRTLLTTIRSSSEILRDHQDMAPKDRRRFVATMARESERLSGIVDRMLVFAAEQGMGDGRQTALPEDEIDDILQARGNHFPSLEEAAARLRMDAGIATEEPMGDRLDRLIALAALEVVSARADGASPALDREPAADAGRLVLDSLQTRPTRRFRIVRAAAMRICADDIDALVEQERLGGDDAVALYRKVLGSYLAGAVLLPYEPFLAAARRDRYDIVRLRAAFDASFEQICHRLTTLQRAKARGVPFHFIRVDIAGRLSKRFSASGLGIPRHGGLGPRWLVHSAFMTPGQIRRQKSRSPEGGVYLDIARTVGKGVPRFGEPEWPFAVGLGCEIEYADQVVYGDGLDLEAAHLEVPLGGLSALSGRRDRPKPNPATRESL